MPRKAKKAKKKSTARKTTRKPAKRATAKRKAAPKVAARKSGTMKKVNVGSVKKAYSKSQILEYISECTELSKKDISNVFESLNNLMKPHLKSRGPGEFTFPGLLKCTVKRKPATKARKGINPFTGEAMMFKAKPARNIVKVRPLKKLKEMVE